MLHVLVTCNRMKKCFFKETLFVSKTSNWKRPVAQHTYLLCRGFVNISHPMKIIIYLLYCNIQGKIYIPKYPQWECSMYKLSQLLQFKIVHVPNYAHLNTRNIQSASQTRQSGWAPSDRLSHRSCQARVGWTCDDPLSSALSGRMLVCGSS